MIPHQSVLQNVELALTLSGVSKKERRQRAREALERVGLGNQLRKKPGEMSGGQMQRVAIARALVNNPDIILADEPTGALDTETSVQVMEILKEISKDRLVVMVTHNPDLAETYSTRIIRMLDGEITGDSAPLTEEELAAETEWAADRAQEEKKKKRPSMSFATSFGLSLKNLFTKKGRTALTGFAGSIGIIGIALIYAVSQGMTTYIDTVQEDTLSSYPLTLEATHTDMGSLLSNFISKAQSAGQHEKDAVYQKTMLYDLVNSLNAMKTTENDLKAFKAYLEAELADTSKENPLADAISGVQYTYDLDLTVYTESVDGTIVLSDTQELLQELLLEYFNMDMSSMMSFSESYGFDTSMMMPGMGSANLWQEILPAKDGGLINDLLYKQYDVIAGSWPTAYNEIVLVVDENNEIDDMTLYALGLKSKEEVDALAKAAIDKTEVTVEQKHWSYEEICGMTFRTVLASDRYTYDEKNGLYKDLSVDANGNADKTGLKYLYDNGLDLKVTGIIRPSEDAVSSMLKGSLAYTHALTEYIIENGKDAPAVQAQLADSSIDIFTGLPFKENTGNLSKEEKKEEFRHYVEGLNDQGKADLYVKIKGVLTEEERTALINKEVEGASREAMEAALMPAMIQKLGQDTAAAYLRAISDEAVKEQFTKAVIEQEKAKRMEQEKAQLDALSPAQIAAKLAAEMETYTDDQYEYHYDEVISKERKKEEFHRYVEGLDEQGKADLYVKIKGVLTEEERAALIGTEMEKATRETMEATLLPPMVQLLGEDTATEYLRAMSDEELKTFFEEEVTKHVKEQKATQVKAQLSALPPAQLAGMLAAEMGAYTDEQYGIYYDEVLEFSESTYEDNLLKLGYVHLDDPDTISIYASSFENKDVIVEAIAAYNEKVDDLEEIVYTDYIGLMMSSITTIINAISYVLIAFVAISLVVSSIMIGVITLISVQERTKEIGILRAIGASKRNVSSMFNAETMIIGFLSGGIGVGITYLLCIPINLILNHLTEIDNLRAFLPIEVAAVLIGISVLLTLVAGIIPSRSAAKKDPVVALRTE